MPNRSSINAYFWAGLVGCVLELLIENTFYAHVRRLLQRKFEDLRIVGIEWMNAQVEKYTAICARALLRESQSSELAMHERLVVTVSNPIGLLKRMGTCAFDQPVSETPHLSSDYWEANFSLKARAHKRGHSR